MAALRWGFLSVGRITSDFVNAMKNMPKGEAVLQACAARSLERSQDFAKTHGIASAYGSYEELCKDPSVDIVYVGTLNTTHHEHALMALNHGKHVLVEKPIAVNARQAKEMISVARQKNLFFMEGEWTRFFPAIRHVRKLLSDGAIGDVHHVQVSRGEAMPTDNERIWNRRQGGGGCLDLGIYVLTMISMVFGPHPNKVTAVGELTEGGVDAYASLTLQYPDGKFASGQYTCKANLPQVAEITGSKGRIHIHHPYYVASDITLEQVQPDGSVKKSTPEFPIKEEAKTSTGMNHPRSEGFVYEIQAVTQAIREGKTEIEEVSHAETLAIVNLLDQVRSQLGVVYDEDLIQA